MDRGTCLRMHGRPDETKQGRARESGNQCHHILGSVPRPPSGSLSVSHGPSGTNELAENRQFQMIAPHIAPHRALLRHQTEGLRAAPREAPGTLPLWGDGGSRPLRYTASDFRTKSDGFPPIPQKVPISPHPWGAGYMERRTLGRTSGSSLRRT